ncbi:MAG: hypothetical protein V4692_09050, partial [Bdellovibrionota bacterium]
MGIKFSSAFLVLIAVLCTLIGFQNCSPGFKAIAPQGTRLLESAVPAQLEVTVSQTGAAEFTQHR